MENMILGQLRIGKRQMNFAALASWLSPNNKIDVVPINTTWLSQSHVDHLRYHPHHGNHNYHYPHDYLMTTLMLSPSTPPDSLPDSPISLLIDFAKEPALPGLKINILVLVTSLVSCWCWWRSKFMGPWLLDMFLCNDFTRAENFECHSAGGQGENYEYDLVVLVSAHLALISWTSPRSQRCSLSNAQGENVTIMIHGFSDNDLVIMIIGYLHGLTLNYMMTFVASHELFLRIAWWAQIYTFLDDSVQLHFGHLQCFRGSFDITIWICLYGNTETLYHIIQTLHWSQKVRIYFWQP